MTKYNVHLFREMRLYFPNIEGNSPAEAARNASGSDTGEAEEIEDCNGEDLGALVDVVGDDDFGNSELIDFEPQRMLNAAPKLLAALQQVLAFAANRDVPPVAALNAVASIAERTLTELHGRAA